MTTGGVGYRGAVRVDPRGALLADTRLRSHRALAGGVSLAVLVVAVAGVSGTTHFAGPRWVPNLTISAGSHHAPPPRTRAGHVSTGGGHFPTWLVIAALGVLAAVALWAVARWLWRRWPRRRSRPAPGPRFVAAATTSEIVAEPEPDTPAVRSGIETALEVLDAQREPADAIVRAWLGLQQTAEDSGIVRGVAETPTEFTTRIIGRAVTDDRAIRTLLRLYLRTRFGDHPVTVDDVALVRTALHELVRTWPVSQSVGGARVR